MGMPGFWSNLLASLGRNSGSTVFTPRETYLSASEFGVWADVSSLSAAEMWASQPHFRTVVTFLARNVAQLGLHSFERAGESDRKRDRDSVAAQALRDVDGTMTTYELVFSLVGDLALYDRAYWWVATSSDMPSGWMIRRLPPTWVEQVKSDPWTVDRYKVHGANGVMELPATSVLAFPGYDPSKMCGSSPTVDALRQTLQEQVEAAAYRAQVWKRGGRASSVIERPADAPAWSDAARESFREDWYSKFTGRGSRAGGTPILEDGMSLKRIDFNAQEQQFVEAAKLSLVTVASAFHVNPTMIGQNDGANYSNVREFRKMLYGDTLGPILAQVEARLNSFLYPMMGMDRNQFYAEFNIEEKLQGNFEEQTAALQSSTGAPWMTRNEARALRNLPAVEGGDDLVVPLNVLIGGQSSPRDGETAGGGGEVAAAEPVESATQTVGGFTADEIVKLVGAAATLIRSGFEPEASLLAVGLDPVAHLGLLPITVQRPERAENPDEEIEDALKLADDVLSKAALDGRVFKSGPTGPEVAKHAEVLANFFRRQGSVVQSRIGAGGDWWDKDRWDGELTEDLLKLASMVSVEAASRALETQGLDPSDYDVDGTLAFLREASRRNAEAINETTRSQVDSAINADDESSSVEDRAAQVFKVAVSARALQSAARLAGFSAGFGTVEAGRQSGAASKTWVTGPNPRDSHARMDGETVGLDEDFSNGLAWPGAAGDPDETAGCNCSMLINYPRR